MNKVIVYALCFTYSISGLAGTAVQDQTPSFVTPQHTPSTTPSFVAPHVPPPPPATQPNINPGANQGQQAENNGSGANNAAGAALIAAAMPLLSNPQTMPMGMMLMALGMLALAQGGADSGAAGQSGNTAAATSLAGTGTTSNQNSDINSGASTNPLDSGLKSAFATPEGKKALAAAQAAGGSISAAGVTMPDGSVKPWSAFQSASSMDAAGLDGKGAMASAAEIMKKAGIGNSVSSKALAEGATGAGAPNQFGGGEENKFQMPKFTNPFAVSDADKAKMAAGATLMRGGDPIGVSMDNLFAMIHRAYDRKSGQEEFLPTAGVDEVSVRAPASVSSSASAKSNRKKK